MLLVQRFVWGCKDLVGRRSNSLCARRARLALFTLQIGRHGGLERALQRARWRWRSGRLRRSAVPPCQLYSDEE